MTRPNCAPASNLHLLEQLFAAATHDASAVMCRWTGGVVRLTMDELSEISLEDACRELNFGDDPLTMIVLDLEGDLGGSMVLAFDPDDGRRLAASLLGPGQGDRGRWDELAQSALAETGNILSCAYVNALTRLIDRPLSPSPPWLVEDYGASVVQQMLVAQAAAEDAVLVCRACFWNEDRRLSWRVLFVPSPALRAAMEEALREST